VLEDVLTVAGAVFHPAQQLDQLGMDAVDACFKGCAFAFAADDGVDLAPGFLHHFLNAGGMDAPV
jgi:hypothetical protein